MIVHIIPPHTDNTILAISHGDIGISINGNSCCNCIIKESIDGCTDTIFFNLWGILIIDWFINVSTGFQIFINLGILKLTRSNWYELFRDTSDGRMMNSDEAWHPSPKDTKPIGGCTVTLVGMPDGSQTFVNVRGVFVEIIDCPCPIETADGVGVLAVVTTAEQSSRMLSLSKNKANTVVTQCTYLIDWWFDRTEL